MSQNLTAWIPPSPGQTICSAKSLPLQQGWLGLTSHILLFLPLVFRLSNDPSSFASFITDAILLGMDLFTPYAYKPGKKNSPKFNSQCAKYKNNKNHYFNEWKRLQIQHSRTSLINSSKTCAKTIKNAKSSFVHRINNKFASCQAGSRSFWSMAKVVSQDFCQSSLLRLHKNSDSSTAPSSKANLFASVFASDSNLNEKLHHSTFKIRYITH